MAAEEIHGRERPRGHVRGDQHRSWEKATAAAVALAAKSLRDLRVAEVTTLDMNIEDGKIKSYRARLKVSFKYEGGS
jgi:flavin-binding protein dodecin